MNTFSWSKIVKISFKRKQFFIQLRKEMTESFDTLLGFNLASYRSCKNLWKSAVEHHSFFRLHAPHATSAQATTSGGGSSGLRGRSPTTKKFLTLNLGSKFRYSGRGTEFKSMTVTPEGTLKPIDKVDISRTSLLRKTLPLHLEPPTVSAAAAASSVHGGQEDKKVPRLASPETSSIGSSVHSNGGLKAAAAKSASAASVPKRGQQQTDLEVTPTNSHQSLAHRAIESFNNKVQSLSSKLPKKAWQDEPTSDDEGMYFIFSIKKLGSF